MKEQLKRKHMSGKGKWLLSLLVSLCLTAGMLPGEARAETKEGGLCPHHTEHTADCGYEAAVDGSECTHVHDENCGYAQASECTHVHDENCGYVEGREGNSCNYVCRICPVQELIDGLPEAEEITAENMEMAAAQLAAVDDAKEKLEDEEREQLITAKYEAAASRMMELQDQAAGGPSAPEANEETAAAYKEYYPIWVAGVRVTSLNAGNVLEGDPVNDGKVRYDPDTQTLTLDGANITYTSSSDANVIITRNNSSPTGRTDLTIQLLNENKIISETSCFGQNEDKRRTIDACDDLTFIGGGSLEIIGTASTGGPIITIHAGRTLKFENTAVTAIAGDCPSESRDWDRSWAVCGESIQIIGGKVTARSGWATDAGSSTAITSSWGDIEISNNAEVIAEAGRGESSYAISTDYTISISDSKVSAVGGEAAFSSYGMGADKIMLYNSEIKAEAGTGESGYSLPIYCGNGMEVNDSTVTAKGGAAGAESYGISAASFVLNGGDVHAEGGTAADWSIGLWTENANISAGRLVAIAGPAAGTNAISSAPNFINDYIVTVKAGTSEGDAKAVEPPVDETYWDNTYVMIKPRHFHAWAEQWSYDEIHHWHACTGDDCEIVDLTEMESYGEHTYDDEYDADCNICGAKRNAASKPSYAIIEGANRKWILNEDGSLSIKGNGDFDKFEGVKVDDQLLDRENYNVRPGSTIVELKPDYLNTLAAGSHELEILWTDGSASTVFSVAEKTTNNDSNNNGSSNNGGSNNSGGSNDSSGSNNSGGSNDSNNNNGDTGNHSNHGTSSNSNENGRSIPANNTVITTDSNKKDEVPKTGEDISAVWAAAILAISGTGMVLTRKKQSE